MHATTVRTTRFVVAMSALFGLTLPLIPAPPAAAAPSIQIYNSGASVSTIKVYSPPHFVDIRPGQRGTFQDTPSLRVLFPRCTTWQVRTRGGAYGRRYSCVHYNSNPAHQSAYIYKTS